MKKENRGQRDRGQRGPRTTGSVTACVPADWTALCIPAPAAADPSTVFDARREGRMAQTARPPQSGGKFDINGKQAEWFSTRERSARLT